MATRWYDITDKFSSRDTEVYPDALSNHLATAAREYEIWVMEENGIRVGMDAQFKVPDDYVGTPEFVVVWTKAAAASGDVEFDGDYRTVTQTGNFNTAGNEESLNTAGTAPGTIGDGVVTVLTPSTPANFNANEFVQYGHFRDALDAGDTLAADAIILAVFFRYADA